MLTKKYDEILTLTEKIDKDSILYYSFFLKPPVWTSGLELVSGEIIAPTVPTGYYYEVVSSGVTGVTEPTWATIANSKTTDNTIVYKAVNNTAYLRNGQTLNTTLSFFSTTELVPIVDTVLTVDGRADVKVGPVPAGTSSFILTFSFWVDTGFGEEEYDEQSIKIKLKDN